MQRLVIFAFFLSFFVSTSYSQTIGGVEVVKPRILFGKWDASTKKLPVIVEFTLAPKWHLYWINPGDAGSPPEAKWTLPEGWKADPLSFPVPQKLEEDGLTSYVYFNKLVLSTDILAPENPVGKNLSVDLKWMVCKDICVPGSKQLEVKVTEAASLPEVEFIPRLIQSGIETWTMRDVASDGKKFQLRLGRGDKAVTVEEFYPGPVKNGLVSFEVKDGILSYAIRPEDPSKATGQINGLVKVEGKTYWLK